MAGEGDTERVELTRGRAVGRPAALPARGGEPPPGSLLRIVANLIGARGRPRARRPSAPARRRWATSSTTCSPGAGHRPREHRRARRGAGLRPVRRRERDRRPRAPAARRGGRLAGAGAHRRRARRPRRWSAPRWPRWPRPAGRATAARRRRRRRPGERELVILAPGPERGAAARVAGGGPCASSRRACRAHVTVARSRHAADPADLHRAGTEALLAANVAEARGLTELSFEETGAYRLLLPAMSEDPSELQGFFEETVAPLVDYDEQYETELVRTLETFLDADGNVARHRRAPLHPPPHDPLPARARARADRARRGLHRRPRAPVPRPEGDARAGHRAARRPGARAGRRGRPRAARATRTASAAAPRGRGPRARTRSGDGPAGSPRPNHDQLRHVQPEGAWAWLPSPTIRALDLALERLLGAAGELGVALPAGRRERALWSAIARDRGAGRAPSPRSHMLPSQRSPSTSSSSVPLMRGEPSCRRVASVLCLLSPNNAQRARGELRRLGLDFPPAGHRPKATPPRGAPSRRP